MYQIQIVSQGNCKTFKHLIVLMLYKLFQRIENEGKLSHSFYEANNNIETKIKYDLEYRPITYDHLCKNPK